MRYYGVCDLIMPLFFSSILRTEIFIRKRYECCIVHQLAESIKLINEANPGKGVIALRSLESLEKVADGQSTKLIIPSEIQSVAGLAASVKEMIEK